MHGPTPPPVTDRTLHNTLRHPADIFGVSRAHVPKWMQTNARYRAVKRMQRGLVGSRFR